MNPLSKKIRLISLIITLILFIIIGPLILAYSVGYRFDDLNESFGWVRTGGIYIHSDISNTDVLVDGKFAKSGGFLLKNIFIQNLRSDQEHIIEVHKNGFHSWRKVLPVVESYVTEARTMMIPKEITRVAIYPYLDNLGNGFLELSDFKEEEDGKKTQNVVSVPNDTSTPKVSNLNIEELLERGDIKINQNYIDLQILFDLSDSTEGVFDIINKTIKSLINNQPTTTTMIVDDTKIVEPAIVPDYFVKLGIDDPSELKNLITNNDELLWLDDGNIVIHWIGSNSDAPYYYCNFSVCRNSLFINWETEILRFSFLPNRNDVIVLMNENGIWATELDDRSTRNIQPIYIGENLDFRINDNNRIVVLDGEVFYELRF